MTDAPPTVRSLFTFGREVCLSDPVQDFRGATIPLGGVRLYWLGQAGSAFRMSAGRRVFLDPYLSDSCERLHGFKRLSLPALRPEQVEADWVIVTHEHTDHLDPDAIKPLYALKPDVVLPAINGVFGNMNHIDAARLVSEAKPRIAIPCHFWTFAEQGAGDPGGFINACRQMCPEVHAMLLRPGEGLTVGRHNQVSGVRNAQPLPS